jgi:hypothetical protein
LELRDFTGSYIKGGLILMRVAIFAAISIKETFGKDLHFVEK